MNKAKNNPIRRGLSVVSRILEIVFLALAGIYLLYQTSGVTTFYLPYPWWFDKALLRTMAVVTVLRLLILGPRRWETWGSVAMAAVYYFVFESTGYRFMVYLGVLTAGFSGIDYHKILKIYLYTVGTAFCVTVLAALSGAITNFVYTRAGDGIRSSWGFCYPTDFASIALFLMLVLWAVWNKLPDWAMLLFCAASFLLARCVAHSDTSTICSLLFAVAILCHGFEKNVVAKHSGLRWMRHGSDWLLTLAFPICAVAMFALMVAYRRALGAAIWADDLLSDRLRLAVSAWQEHGIRDFGTPFEQIGNGFSTVASANYNFVDSSYPLILIRYGWVLLLTLGILWGWTIRRVIKCGDKRLALVMGIIAFHSFAEHHFIEVNYNILLVMPFALYADRPKEMEARANIAKERWIAVLSATVVVGLLLCIGLPRLLPCLKTIFQAENLCGGGRNGWRVIFINLGIIAIVSFTWRSLSRIVIAAMEKQPVRRCAAAIAALIVCVGVAGGSAAYGERIVARVIEENTAVVEQDRAALEIAEDSAVNGIYSNLLPNVYSRVFAGISDPILSGEELARYRGSTLLMDSGVEYPALINSGFLYSRISDAHAVYTGDPAVAKALKNNGYSVTGYYNEIKDVDLAYEARLNNLDYSEESGLALDGPLQSLTMGPYLTLFNGGYVATFDLRLPEQVPHDDNVVCNLRVCCTWGENTLAEQEIRGSQFDESGALSVDVRFYAWNGEGVELLVFDEDGSPVNVEGIRYARTANYDVHSAYDDKLRVIRQEYYSLDNGEPETMYGGYFACENSYDRAGNISERRYFDANDKPVLINSGYAMARYTYNRLKKLTRAEYYGTDGKLIALPAGQAIEELDYDRQGNVVCYRYYGSDEKPAMTTYGYAELRRVLNEEGQPIHEDYIGVDGLPLVKLAGYASVDQEYDDEGNLTVRRYLDAEGNITQRTDGYSEARWAYNDERTTSDISFYNLTGEKLSLQGINLAMDTSSEWSAWMTPANNRENATFNVSSANLGPKEAGDLFTCQLEIEFKNVTATEGCDFRFRTQGAADGQWNIGNVWDARLIYLDAPPQDGLYKFTVTHEVNEKMAAASTFNLGFRCDYWASGSFRVRCVKVEKGDMATEWSPGV